ncbi:hypothetical protein SAMN02745244_02532 [Tessaracoccus bendigoensis DSM 12906]|uniref:Uncharacterized protein n=1 Tax=Tessaracoccus bendigoensis DSM 12906 TaxID=1123357 RepID=A0A1M6JDB2_9ACTN|nr:hypothetical protein [Tessaracoccus bendigoensis]SHJ44678.1 hypothetical protein SAMN02745244_02532 [Tessaracoccus bendigoensis DSM 12906]
MRGPIGARIMDRIGRRQHLVAGFITKVPGPDRFCISREEEMARIGG